MIQIFNWLIETVDNAHVDNVLFDLWSNVTDEGKEEGGEERERRKYETIDSD